MSNSKIDRFKVWCFDNLKTEEEVREVWEKALKENKLVVQLKNSGITYSEMPPHILTDMFNKYGQL